MGVQSQSQSELNSCHHHVLRRSVLPNGMLTGGLASKVSMGGIVPGYNISNNKPHNGLQNKCVTFDDMSFLVSLPHDYSSRKKMGPTIIFSAGEESGTSHMAESLNDGSAHNMLYPEQYNQDDLLTAILKQQQEGFGQLENEFGFEKHALDDLPV